MLEVSHAVAGPTAAQLLCDYGAEIIKIERPRSGDIFRDVPGMGPTMFLAVNRGKKSVCLDLKIDDGLSIFYRLVQKSDVVIENMGPGVAENLGISFQRIRRANRRAIYCKIESFGSGPNQNSPAFDPILQAAVGIMSTTGFPPDRFARAGVSLVDMSTGLHAAVGIISLLFQRDKSGRGGELRVSLYDAASYFMSYWIAMYDLFGRDTTPLGSGHIFGSPYNLFRTEDGFVYLAIANDSQWGSFCRRLGFEDLLAEKKYQSAAGRVKLKKSLEKDLFARLARIGTKQVESRLKDSGVPFGKFNTAGSLLQDEHFLGRGILKPYLYEGRKYRTTVNPALINGNRHFAKSNPPKLGADATKVLASILGLTENDLSRLRSKGVLG